MKDKKVFSLLAPIIPGLTGIERGAGNNSLVCMTDKEDVIINHNGVFADIEWEDENQIYWSEE